MTRPIGELPNALRQQDELEQRLAGRKIAVFLDYDGTLTPIVDRPEDAVLSESMRAAVRALAARCTVCVVSGRDRPVVQELMGVGDLVVAGSHGFDIWSPSGGAIQKEHRRRVRRAAGRGDGAAPARARNDPRRGGRAQEGVRRRPLPARRRGATAQQVKDIVEAILAEHPDELKVTPGKMVLEIQPKIDWDKGKAVLHLLEALGLDGPDVIPLYLGDDHTDEHAFEALVGRGIGILVGHADDPELAGRTTSADYSLASVEEVERFLDALARPRQASMRSTTRS